MTEFADLILRSGRAAVEFALFILLPIMIVMLTMMRLLEAKGVLDRIVALVTPALRPLGVEWLDMPATPERIRAALRNAKVPADA